MTAFLGLLAGILGGIVVSILVGRYRAISARGLAERLIAEARREADTIGRQAELDAKVEAIKRREELDAEADSIRRDLREQGAGWRSAPTSSTRSSR